MTVSNIGRVQANKLQYHFTVYILRLLITHSSSLGVTTTTTTYLQVFYQSDKPTGRNSPITLFN